MSEYPSPGVYIDETPFRSKSVEGASTSTTGFVGPTLKGPTTGEPELLTSLGEFEETYGKSATLSFPGPDGTPHHTSPYYMWYAARAFFMNGGRKLYVARANSDTAPPDASSYQVGLDTFVQNEDISILAAPALASEAQDLRDAVMKAMIAHCEHMQYRVAVLDSALGMDLAQVVKHKDQLSTSKFGALYYPWVSVLEVEGKSRLLIPPSGFIAGVYARSDAARGVHKPPANEELLGALGVERSINSAQQQPLNTAGVNCLRYLDGRGYRVWGARTMSDDSEWKYLNVRRFFNYLERSIDRGTQWAVFEPNGQQLWDNVRRSIEDFLYNEYRQGTLLGDRPEKAYFVRCDRSTMTQNDLDNGRLVCHIGVAPLKPAEFIIIKIGQWTADARS